MINYERCYPSRLKKYFRRDINYEFYDEIIPHVKQQTIGNIPPEITDIFPKSKRGEKIKAFQQVLGDMANFIRATRNQMKSGACKSYEDFHSPLKVTIYEYIITNLINKKLEPILGKNYYTELKFAGNGGFAEVFRLSVYDLHKNKIMHDKALKVFYNIVEPLDYYKSFHNNFAEANFWSYISYNAGHKLDKTQFTRHYISDMKSGYYLTEFIDKDTKATTSYLDLKKFGIWFDDRINNRPIKDKEFYDGGGFEKLYNFIDDKVVLRYYKKIINRNTEKERLEVLANQERLAENPKTPHRDKIKSANELYKIYRQKVAEQSAKAKEQSSPLKRFIKMIKDKIAYFNNNKK